MNNNPNDPARKPYKPAGTPEDPLQRQINETKRREHDKHLSRYRVPNPNAPRGD